MNETASLDADGEGQCFVHLLFFGTLSTVVPLFGLVFTPEDTSDFGAEGRRTRGSGSGAGSVALIEALKAPVLHGTGGTCTGIVFGLVVCALPFRNGHLT